MFVCIFLFLVVELTGLIGLPPTFSKYILRIIIWSEDTLMFEKFVLRNLFGEMIRPLTNTTIFVDNFDCHFLIKVYIISLPL